MATSTFITLMIAFVLLILVVSRIEGNPKLCANLLFALAFGVVVGLGIQSKKSTCTHSDNDTQTEMISELNQLPMQNSVLFADVTAQTIITNSSAGQVYNWFNGEGKDLQQPRIIPNPARDIGVTAYEDSG